MIRMLNIFVGICWFLLVFVIAIHSSYFRYIRYRSFSVFRISAVILLQCVSSHTFASVIRHFNDTLLGAYRCISRHGSKNSSNEKQLFRRIVFSVLSTSAARSRVASIWLRCLAVPAAPVGAAAARCALSFFLMHKNTPRYYGNTEEQYFIRRLTGAP